MRRRNVLILAAAFVVGGLALVAWNNKASWKQHKSSPIDTHVRADAPDHSESKVTASTPVEIRVPKLGLQATIQAVGLNKQGNMAAPNKLTDAAWYKPGPKPGNVGNAVIAGHYGKPHQAAFWNLSQLKAGDTIEVVDSNEQSFKFTVTDTERVSPTEAQRQRIFGTSDARHLNLITCDGAWDAQTRSYDLRFIVYATLRPK